MAGEGAPGGTANRWRISRDAAGSDRGSRAGNGRCRFADTARLRGGAAMKVMIVDDEAPARDRLRRLLAEIEDCEFAGEAGNGREAVDLAARLDPDVVLMDIRMPGMDGVEA